MWGAHKTLLIANKCFGVLSMTKPACLIRILLPSPTIISLQSLYSEWMDRFGKSKVMWCETPKSMSQYLIVADEDQVER